MATTTTAAREATDDGGSVVLRDVGSLGVLGCLLVSLCCCRLLWLLLWSGSGLLREMTTATTTTTACGDDNDDDNDKQAATTAGLAPPSTSHRGGIVSVGSARTPSKVPILESKTLGVPQKEMVGQPSPWGEGRPTGSPSPPVPESTGGRLGRGQSPCRQGCDHRTAMPGTSSHKAGGRVQIDKSRLLLHGS